MRGMSVKKIIEIKEAAATATKTGAPINNKIKRNRITSTINPKLTL
jgi:hypothetical protein